ncbi:hypothetical protein BDF22DRAFT_691409 [Syncephalis plumigaleata]|nr:hypothetical protein BDF22DRAFT_691409 [Syncephalis plumigaleata]
MMSSDSKLSTLLPTDFIDLNHDTIYEIMRYISCRQSIHLMLTCRTLFRIISSYDYWWQVMYTRQYLLHNEHELDWLRSTVGYCRHAASHDRPWQLPWFYVYCCRRRAEHNLMHQRFQLYDVPRELQRGPYFTKTINDYHTIAHNMQHNQWIILRHYPDLWAHCRAWRSPYRKSVTLHHIDGEKLHFKDYSNIATGHNTLLIHERDGLKAYVAPIGGRGLGHMISPLSFPWRCHSDSDITSKQFYPIIDKPKYVEWCKYNCCDWSKFHMSYHTEFHGPWIVLKGYRRQLSSDTRRLIYHSYQRRWCIGASMNYDQVLSDNSKIWHWDPYTIGWTNYEIQHVDQSAFHFTIHLWEWSIMDTTLKCRHHAVLRLGSRSIRSEQSTIFTEKIDDQHALFIFNYKRRNQGLLYRMERQDPPRELYVYSSDKRGGIIWTNDIKMNTTVTVLYNRGVFITQHNETIHIYDLWSGHVLRTTSDPSNGYPYYVGGGVFMTAYVPDRPPQPLGVADLRDNNEDLEVYICKGGFKNRHVKIVEWKRFNIMDCIN